MRMWARLCGRNRRRVGFRNGEGTEDVGCEDTYDDISTVRQVSATEL